MSAREPEPQPLKARIRDDLTAAIKARDDVTMGSLRMALAAIATAEVAGKQAVELTDAEVVAVINREVKKRQEAHAAFADAGRAESAAKEAAEADILRAYLPAQLSEGELQALIAEAIEAVSAEGLTGGRAMGAVMKRLGPQTAGRADGAAIAAAVKASLGI